MGSVLLMAVMTVLIIATVMASYSAAQLHFSSSTDYALREVRTADHIADTAAFLHTFDGSTTLNSDTSRLTLVQQTGSQGRRCVVVDYGSGTLRSKVRRLGPTEPPTGVCESSERHVLDDGVAPISFTYRDAAGAIASPSAAKTVELTLTDNADATKTMLVVLRING